MVFRGVTVEFTWTPDPARLDWAAGPVPTGPTPFPWRYRNRPIPGW